jgi:hypothetical protein
VISTRVRLASCFPERVPTNSSRVPAGRRVLRRSLLSHPHSAFRQDSFQAMCVAYSGGIADVMRSCPYIGKGLRRAGSSGNWLTGRPRTRSGRLRSRRRVRTQSIRRWLAWQLSQRCRLAKMAQCEPSRRAERRGLQDHRQVRLNPSPSRFNAGPFGTRESALEDLFETCHVTATGHIEPLLHHVTTLVSLIRFSGRAP